VREATYLTFFSVTPCGSGWALRAEIGMTINLSGHPMLVTQHYLNLE